ncbi:peptidase inhibitor family I36 protein [Streptomyces sp. NPDC026665]|uniref:peptidase inhibitor family I36 protein n=1 Tax=Streptomyces sp. NPDC026665 TaxID=3154798 RepID=UPI0033DF9F9A
MALCIAATACSGASVSSEARHGKEKVTVRDADFDGAARGDCEEGKICLYQDAGYQGGMADGSGIESITRNFGHVDFENGIRANDNVSSVINNMKFPVTLFSDENFKGSRLTIAPGGALSNLAEEGSNGSNFNDVASSMGFS